ncbi:DNRLRE domain-containing protein, partial [Nanoarchaeota archaeon]
MEELEQMIAEGEKRRRKKFMKYALLALAIVMLVIGMAWVFDKTGITGFQVAEFETLNYEQDVSLTLTSDDTYDWMLDAYTPAFNMRSVRVDAEAMGKGRVKAYLVAPGGSEYLIFNELVKPGDTMGNLITGGAVIAEEGNETVNETQPPAANETVNETNAAEPDAPAKEISIDLAYQAGTRWDADDDGLAFTSADAVDFTVENSAFNWEVDESKACTKWTVVNDLSVATSLCNGGAECCAVAGLAPHDETWDSAFYLYYEQYGSTLANTVEAQVLFVDQSLVEGEVYFDSAQSSVAALDALFEEAPEKAITDACSQTCALADGFNATSYTLRFEVEAGMLLKVKKIKYSLEVLEAGNLTVDTGNVTVDPSIKNALGRALDVDIDFVEPGTDRKMEGKRLAKGKYKVKVNLTRENMPVKKIEMNDVSVDENMTAFVNVDDVAETGDLAGFAEVYAIDPTAVNFSNATVTVVATGQQLLKCKEWDFDAQRCDGTWDVFKRGLVPGQEYTFILTPDDPGFGEINITKAEHLDIDYTFIADVYNQTYLQDDVWTGNIDDDQIVQVTFETDLTNGSVLDLFVRDGRVKNNWIEVYKANTTSPLLGQSGDFGTTGEWVYINISNLAEPTDMFDLKMVSGAGGKDSIQFDYIHDAIRTVDDTAFVVNTTSITEGDPIYINVTYRIGTGGAPVTDWIIQLNETNNGIVVGGACGAGDVFMVTSANTSGCAVATPCTYNSNGTITIPQAHAQNKDMPMVWYLTACGSASTYSPADLLTYQVSGDGGNTLDLQTGGITIESSGPPIIPPPSQTTELGNETEIVWNISGNGGYYWTYRNGTLFEGPLEWSSGTQVITTPNVYFLGVWNYSLVYNETGGSGASTSTLFTVQDTQFASCDGEAGTGQFVLPGPTLRTITVDGDMSDWDGIINNPYNYVSDLTEAQGDLDDIQTDDRDMIKFAYTYDQDYMYFYYYRSFTGSRQVSMIAYLDYDLDGYMETGEHMVKFVWSGSNRHYDADLYHYNPINVVTGDIMLGDGYNMPGSISIYKQLEQDMLGGSLLGTEVETRVLWSDLGFSEPGVSNLKASCGRGSATNLPSQLEDNIGDVLSASSEFFVLYPDNEKATKNGTTVYYDHEIKNCGNQLTTIDFANTSSQGWTATLYYPYSTETTLTDSNGNGMPDLTLGADDYNTVIVRVDVPSAASMGTVDVSNITANNSDRTKSVYDTTTVADIAILPAVYDVYGTQGLKASFNFTVYNYQIFNDTLELTITSTNGWTTAVYYANGTQAVDTDGDGRADLGGFIPFESKDLYMTVEIPGGASSGTEDQATIRINSSVDPSNTVFSTANITVRDRLILVPSGYNRTVNSDTRQYFEFNITNNWNETEAIELNNTYTLGWETTYVDYLKQPLNDTDSDGNVDIVVPGYGATRTFYVKVQVPQNTTMGLSEITTLYANSSLNTSLYMTALINETPRGVTLYNDSGRTDVQYTYVVGSPVYARAFYLTGLTTVYMTWYDGFNYTKTSDNITVTGGGTADDWVQTNSSLGVHYWTVTVYNADDHTEVTRNQFLVTDPVDPNLTAILPVPGANVNTGGQIEVKANATDNVYISYVEANIAYPNGTNYTLDLLPDGGINYSNFFTAPIYLTGRFNITYLAFDLFGNVNDSEESYFNVYDNIPPSVFDLQPDGNEYNYSDVIEISANVTDNIAVDKVFANITFPNSTVLTIELTPAVGDKYNNSFTVPSLPGAYNVMIWANDTSGNINDTESTYFTAVAPVPTYPEVYLNSPPDNLTTSNRTIEFNWTAISDQYGSMVCNLTIDGVVNVSNIVSTNNTPTTQIVSGFTEAPHYWNVTCWGEPGYINTSETRNFTISGLTITLISYRGLNSSLEDAGAFNTSNLEEIEYSELNFSITTLDTIDSWYLNFTANGTNGCSLGNKQEAICYNYDNANYQWIWFVNGSETTTYDGTQGNQGDRIIETPIGSGSNVNVSYLIDEHYNPNVFKWYSALYNFSDVKWQNSSSARINGNGNIIKIEVNQNIVPLDADQYKLDFRVQHNNPEYPLEAFACNSSYSTGLPHDFAGCALVTTKYPSELQDDGTKFRGIFTRQLIDELGDLKYILLEIHSSNSSEYYAIKTYKATKGGYTTHWEYTNDEGQTWNNSGDGYETEMNINWFYDGADPTAFVYRFWANTTIGEEEYLEGNITWQVSPTNNYPPLVSIYRPEPDATIRFPYLIEFNIADPNDDPLNGTLKLYLSGVENKTLAIDLNQSNSSYLWDDDTPDGTYNLTLEACELGTADLFCVNDTHEITVDNTPPEIDLNFPPDNENTTSTSINFNWTATDTIDPSLTCNLTINGVVNASDIAAASGAFTNYTVSGLSDGTYSWNITCWDDTGNTNTSETRTFTVDTTPPEIEFVPPTPNNGTYNTDQTINITANDTNPDTIIIYVNGTPVKTCGSSPCEYNLTEDGNYTVYGWANDTFGNTNQTEPRLIIIDKTPPLVDFEVPTTTTGNHSQDWIYTNVTGSDLYLDTIVVHLYNSTGDLINSTSSGGSPVLFNFTDLPDGTYYINATANDTAGNTNSTGTRTITLDRTEPSVVLHDPDDGLITSVTSFNFNWTAYNGIDPTLDCNLTIDGVVNVTGIASPQGVPTNQTVSGFEDGVHHWNVTCWDDSNNFNTSETWNFTVDTTAPEVYLMNPLNGSTDSNGDLVFFTYNTTDDINITNCTLLLNDTAWNNHTDVTKDTALLFNESDLAENVYGWRVACTNELGNTGTSETWILIVDYPPNPPNGTLIINETIENADGDFIAGTIELIDTGSNQTDTTAQSGETENISAGQYDIKISPAGITIQDVYISNLTIVTNITDVIDLDNYTETQFDFVNTYAIKPYLTGYDYIDITMTAISGDAFVCEEWNFTARTCNQNRWVKMGNYLPGENYTIRVHDQDTFGFMESNMTINLMDFDSYFIVNNQSITDQDGTIVEVLITVDSNTLKNVTIRGHNSINFSNDLRIGDFVNRSGWVNNFIIDPEDLNVVNFTVWKNASDRGTSLWKCKDYNYTEEICNEDLIFVKNVTPYDDYMMFVTAADPVFFEQPDDINGTDAFIDEKTGDTNYGVSDEMRIDDRTSNTKRGMITWNLSSIPPGATVTNAVMELYKYAGSGSDIPLEIMRINESWNETAVTWNTRPDNDTLSYNSTLVTGLLQWYAWNITTLVAEWHNGTYPNYGLYVKASIENAGTANNLKRFYSSDYVADPLLRPRINITYEFFSSPAVDLNYPAPDYTTNSRSVNFNWTATDYYDASMDCNLTIDGVVNVSGIASVNATPTNQTVNGLADGVHYWNVTCVNDDGRFNTSSTRNFTVDATPPQYSSDQDDSGGTVIEGTAVNISVYWQDAGEGLDIALFRSNESGSWTEASSCTFSGAGTGWCNKTIDTTSDAGKYICWNQYANDTLGNLNDTMPEVTHCFTVIAANTPPYDITITDIDGGGNQTITNNSQPFVTFTGYDDEQGTISCSLWVNGTSGYGTNGSTVNATATVLQVNQTLVDGLYDIYMNCSDGMATNISTSWQFEVDTTPPLVQFVGPTPANGTYNTTQTINVTASDPNLDSIVIYVNGTSVQTCGGSPCDYTFPGDGTYTFYSVANDTAGNVNQTETREVIIDTIPPQWSNNETSIASGSAYVPGANYQFNVTWTDSGVGMAGVIIEHNFTGTLQNVSMSNLSSEYYFDVSDLPAGTYVWRSYANDSAENSNQTDQWTYVVAQASTTMNLTSAPSWTETYGTQTTVNCTADNSEVTPTLYRNGTPVSIPDVQTLGAGEYEYICNSSSTLNYTGDSASNTLTINKAASTTDLYLDGVQNNKTVTYGTQTNATAVTSAGSVTLYRNGTPVSNPEIDTLGVGFYNYTAINPGNENYTGSSETWYLTVNKDSTTMNLTATPSWTETYGQQTTVNCTADNSEVTPALYRNGTPVSIPDVQTLGAGTYEYVCNASATQNYTGDSASNTLTINKASTTTNLYLDGVENNKTVTVGTQTNATAITSAVNVTLYRNSTPVTNPEIDTLGAGFYNYTAINPGNENYTGSSATWYLTVQSKTISTCSLQIIPASGQSYPVSANATCSCTNPEAGATLWRNGTDVTSPENNTLVDLYAGDHGYVCNVTETATYTSATNSTTYVVNDGSTTMNLTASPSWTETYGTETTINCTADNSEVTPTLYRNGTPVSIPDVQTLGAGTYEYVC